MNYNYVCECGHEFEETMSLKTYEALGDKPLLCPKCKSEKTKRCINHTPIKFNGKGYYKSYLT